MDPLAAALDDVLPGTVGVAISPLLGATVVGQGLGGLLG